jgi:beta-1,4-N-acetylglucosaminyltransferase
MSEYMKRKPYVCLVASSGGHIDELSQLNSVFSKFNRFYMVPKTPWTVSLKEKKHFIYDMNRKNKITKVFSMTYMFVQQFAILIKERPDVVVTTGAAVAIPAAIFCKICRKKLVYIESICRVKSRSKTGDFMYGRADLFIVQWRELLSVYPEAVYGGSIY